MKKVEENRYPNSATLFRFCKEALELKYEGAVKVIDQDVGAILGYDPADCSHWKKGKKNIRALATLRTLAEHFKIDEGLLIDIASGRLSLNEALFEFKGYGQFELDAKAVESLKKDPARFNSEVRERKWEEIIALNSKAIEAIVAQFVDAKVVNESPVYLPEVIVKVEGFSVANEAALETEFKITISEDQKTTLFQYKDGEIKPYIRFLIAKEIYKHLVRSQSPVLSAVTREANDDFLDLETNLFAARLLVPTWLLAKEVEKAKVGQDIVTQLSETFWVSKYLMNHRLRDYFSNLSR